MPLKGVLEAWSASAGMVGSLRDHDSLPERSSSCENKLLHRKRNPGPPGSGLQPGQAIFFVPVLLTAMLG